MLTVNQCYYKLTQNTKLLWVKNKFFPQKNMHVSPLRQKLAVAVYTNTQFSPKKYIFCLNTL